MSSHGPAWSLPTTHSWRTDVCTHLLDNQSRLLQRRGPIQLFHNSQTQTEDEPMAETACSCSKPVPHAGDARRGRAGAAAAEAEHLHEISTRAAIFLRKCLFVLISSALLWLGALSSSRFGGWSARGCFSDEFASPSRASSPSV